MKFPTLQALIAIGIFLSGCVTTPQTISNDLGNDVYALTGVAMAPWTHTDVASFREGARLKADRIAKEKGYIRYEILDIKPAQAAAQYSGPYVYGERGLPAMTATVKFYRR